MSRSASHAERRIPPTFRFHGECFELDAHAAEKGRALCRGLAEERGRDAAVSVLVVRLGAAGRAFGFPPGPPPGSEAIASTPPAGVVLLTSIAALLEGGVRSFPED